MRRATGSVPSDDAWKAGALALSTAPMTFETLTPGRTPVTLAAVDARVVA